jgi:hypothetical protein
VLDRELDEILGSLPALAIEGPKGVGKTERLRVAPRRSTASTIRRG